MDTTPDQPPEETWSDIPEDILSLTTEEVTTRTRLIDNDLRVRASSAIFKLWTNLYYPGDTFGDYTLAA